MALISTYTTDSSIDGTEFLLGREADGTTKQFALSALQTYLSTVTSSTTTFTGTIVPNADDSLDIGSSAAQWKDLYIDGIAYIDQLGTDADPSTAYISGGEIDGAVIGGESAAAATVTNLTITGDLNLGASTPGTSGQYLRSAGDGAVPTWDTASLNDLSDVLIADDSIYIGHDPSATDSTAQKNVAVGATALNAITTGDNNIAIGYNAGGAITTAEKNVLIGVEAGASMTTTGTAFHNVFIGHHAGKSVTTGAANVAIGANALDASTVGDYNVAVGYSALTSLVSSFGGQSDSNVAVGSNAGENATTMSGAVLIGHNAGNSVTTGVRNIFIGANTGQATTTAFSNVAIGHEALYTNVDGDGGVAIGHHALYNSEPADGLSHNVAIGYEAGKDVTTSTQNTLVGSQAGKDITTGARNIAVGYIALQNNTIGADNVAVGKGALSSNVDGSKSVAIGGDALLQQDPSGAGDMNNTAVGYTAGEQVSTGTNNTLIGESAGQDLETGSGNTALGYSTSFSSTSASNQIVIGNDATGTGDNIAVIGNSSITNINPGSTTGCSLGDSTNSYKDLYLNRKLVTAVDSQDLAIEQYDGEEVARVHDGGAGQSDGDITAVGYGFGFKYPILNVTADSGDKTVTLAPEQSGAIIHCDADTNNVIFNLPAINAANKAGIHYTFVNTTAVNGSKTVKINTNGTDGNDKFLMYGFNGATSITDVAGDTLTIPNSAGVGTVVRVTCLASGESNNAEIWLAEVFGASAVTNA